MNRVLVIAIVVLILCVPLTQSASHTKDQSKSQPSAPAQTRNTASQATKLGAGPFRLKCDAYQVWEFKNGKQVFVDGKPVIVLSISVTNQSDIPVPSGTTIHWSVNAQIQGSFGQRPPLNKGNKLLREVGKFTGFSLPGGELNPKAWYYKTTDK